MAYKKCHRLHNIRFADIRALHLQRTIDEDCPTYSIRKAVRVLLNVLYKYAMKNDIVDKQYSKYIELGKPVKVHDKQPFTDEEIQTLWDNVDKIDGVDTILLMIHSCTRVTEMLTLETAKIKLDERYMIGRNKNRCWKEQSHTNSKESKTIC